MSKAWQAPMAFSSLAPSFHIAGTDGFEVFDLPLDGSGPPWAPASWLSRKGGGRRPVQPKETRAGWRCLERAWRALLQRSERERRS